MKKILLLCILFYGMTFQNEMVPIENFDSDLASSWEGRKKNFGDYYKIEEEEGNKYLAAKSTHSDNFIIKKIKVDIVQYPFFNWKWRAKTLPNNGNESVKRTCDAAASISIVLHASKWKPKAIKYSWSTTLEKGIFTSSPFSIWPSRTDVYIVESGDINIGKWQTEKVNILEHYKQLYELSDVNSKVVEAIVIMTDSDNTQSLSEADYDELYFSKY